MHVRYAIKAFLMNLDHIELLELQYFFNRDKKSNKIWGATPCVFILN